MFFETKSPPDPCGSRGRSRSEDRDDRSRVEGSARDQGVSGGVSEDVEVRRRVVGVEDGRAGDGAPTDFEHDDVTPVTIVDAGAGWPESCVDAHVRPPVSDEQLPRADQNRSSVAHRNGDPVADRHVARGNAQRINAPVRADDSSGETVHRARLHRCAKLGVDHSFCDA